eukprot:CAMPEP_0202726400 /NCGR_PEP_ID=MMETSP1385-20130828/184594_1 /ASSEMBLY_ACC=CAM_ASM_000861 /TAXON_ID=933848 /ORGANISM="Elphidium margaritaceum" /LENGTH=605 /DNA_ID=CAMNT_0049392621 /DNA_START=416 /DNA_END=2233 /DNA_ORIENTATION=-
MAEDGKKYFFRVENTKDTPADKQVRKIYFSIKVKRFSDVDNVRESFRVRFHIYLNWLLTLNEYNDYLMYRKKVEQNPLKKPKWQPKFRPRIDFVNSVEEHHFDPVFYPNQGWYRVMTFPDWASKDVCGFDGAHTMFARFKLDCDLTFSEQMELRSFPLDCQDFTLKLRESNGQKKAILMPEARYIYTTDVDKKPSAFFKLDQTFSVLDEWEFYSTRLEVGDSNAGDSRSGSAYSEVSILFKLARRWLVYVQNVIVYFFFITLLAVLCFALDEEEIGERLNLAVVILLTLVAFQHTVFAKLPNIPYLTFLHKYIITSFVFVCLVIVETAMLTAEVRSETLNDVASTAGGSVTFDVIASWCFGLFWLSYHIFFLLRAGWNRNRQRKKLVKDSVEIADMISDKYPQFLLSWSPLRLLHDTQKKMKDEQNVDTEEVNEKVFAQWKSDQLSKILEINKYPQFLLSWSPLRLLHDTQKKMKDEQNVDAEEVFEKWKSDQLSKILEINQEQEEKKTKKKAVSMTEFSDNGDILTFASYAFDCESKGNFGNFLKRNIGRCCRRCMCDCACCDATTRARDKSVQQKKDNVEQHFQAYRRQSSVQPQVRAQTAEI